MKTFEFWFDFGSPDLYLAFTQITSTKETLKTATQTAVSKGVFGAPTFL